MNERATQEVGIVVERCPSCSAQVAAAYADRCAYCGALFRLEPAAASAAPRAHRLARVRTSRAYSECLVTKPPEAVFYARLSARFLPIPVALAFVALVSRRHVAPPWLWPLALVVVVAAAGAALVRIARFRSAPLFCRPAFVVDERRTVVRRGRRTTTRHFATLAFETGACQEFEVTAAMAAELATGLAGVAFERDGVLLQFRRVDT